MAEKAVTGSTEFPYSLLTFLEESIKCHELYIDKNRRFFLVFCVVFCMPNVPASLHCPFLIAPTVFANTYTNKSRKLSPKKWFLSNAVFSFSVYCTLIYLLSVL